MLFATLAYFMSRSELSISLSHDLPKYAAREKEMMDLALKVFRWAAVVFYVSIVPNVIIPKRDTIMMIAASEYGESALKSDDVREMVNPVKQILKNWINDQLTQSEKKK
jgi:hypothetical protein